MQKIYFFGIAICLSLSTALSSSKIKAQSHKSVTPPSIIENQATEPGIHPTLLWAVIQLVPSPQWISTKSEGLNYGFRWQLTPLLYSWGINRKLSPWRILISEPYVRQSGSAELFFSPEYLNLASDFKNKWLFRWGLRAYFPLVQHGEYLSVSLGSSFFNFNGRSGISYEGGIYLFAGVVGTQVTYSPKLVNSEWLFTIRIRYF